MATDREREALDNAVRRAGATLSQKRGHGAEAAAYRSALIDMEVETLRELGAPSPSPTGGERPNGLVYGQEVNEQTTQVEITPNPSGYDCPEAEEIGVTYPAGIVRIGHGGAAVDVHFGDEGLRVLAWTDRYGESHADAIIDVAVDKLHVQRAREVPSAPTGGEAAGAREWSDSVPNADVRDLIRLAAIAGPSLVDPVESADWGHLYERGLLASQGSGDDGDCFVTEAGQSLLDAVWDVPAPAPSDGREAREVFVVCPLNGEDPSAWSTRANADGEAARWTSVRRPDVVAVTIDEPSAGPDPSDAEVLSDTDTPTGGEGA